MATNTENAQKALEEDQFFAQEELRIKRICQLEEKRRLSLQEEAAAKQAKKEEDVFHFVKPRKSKIHSVVGPHVNVSEADPVAEFISPVSSSSDICEPEPTSVRPFTNVNMAQNDILIPQDSDVGSKKPVLTVDRDEEIVIVEDEPDRWFVREEEEVVIVDDSDDDSLASDLYEPQDFNDEEADYLWVEEEEKLSSSPVVNSIVDSVFESEPPVSEVEADYKYALKVHLEELHQISTVSESELTDYAHFLREAYSRGENAEGKNLDVRALSEAVQREAHCQNLSGQNYTFFAHKQCSATISDVPAHNVEIPIRGALGHL